MCNKVMALANYIRIKVIGKGSYGEVWLGRHKRDKKLYVLKRMDLQKASNRERVAAEQEAKLLSRLRHPNIVTYKDSFETDNGFLYITMQYCEGGDLYTKLKEQKGVLLDQRQVVEWFVQISMALQYMHERNILHRDLKTQNIFLTKSKIIKVGDLGIARVLDSISDMATTLIGTPYYMSPELFSNRPYNHKSDVWALGCCVYEMTTLKHAFNAKDMNSLVYKILRGKMLPIPKQYDGELVMLIKSMLNQEPDKRPSVNRVLRHPFIKTNIQIFLEGTKARQRVSSATDIPSSTTSANQPNDGISPQHSERTNQIPSHIGAGDDSKNVISKLEPIAEQELLKDNADICGNVCSLHQHIEEKSKKAGTDQSTAAVNHMTDAENLARPSEVCNFERKADDPIAKNWEVCNSSEINSFEINDVGKDVPGEIAPSLCSEVNQEPSSREISESASRSRVSKRVVRRRKKSATDYDTESSIETSRSTRSYKVKLVSHRRALPPPPKSEEINGLPSRRGIVIRRETSDAPNVPQGRLDGESKSSASSKSSSTTSSREQDDNAADGCVQKSLPNTSARERRRKQIESSLTTSQDRPQSARRLRLVRHKSANVTEPHKNDPANAPQSGESRHRQPSLADDSSSSAEEAEKVTEKVAADNKKIVKREKREMSDLVNVLDSTLKMNKDDGHESDDSKNDRVAPVIYDRLISAEQRIYSLKSSTPLPRTDSVGNTDRLTERIRLLRRDCIQGIGEERLRQAYDVLEKFENEKIIPKLVDLLGKDNCDLYAGKIWQLKFCEDSPTLRS